MSELFVDKMLVDQLNGEDPFKMFDLNQEQKPSADAASPLFSSMLPQQMNPQQRIDFEKTKMPKMLEQLGVDPKGIALNEVGKMQLMSRFQKKFGPEYNRNPKVLDAISFFDESINLFKMDNDNDYEKMKAKGDRTLRALLGGS